MYVKHIELKNYRNYLEVNLDFKNHLILFLGQNGSGKTNLLESIYYLANGRSHRVASSSDLVNFKSDYAIIRAIIEIENKENLFEIQIHKDGAVKLRFNKLYIKNKQNMFKKLAVVIFSPDDLSMIKSSPSFRREYIDGILAKVQNDFYNIKSRYQKILIQRNSLLKSASNNSLDKLCVKNTFETWDENLAKEGSKLIKARINLLQSLKPKFLRYMNYFFKDRKASLNYVFSWERVNFGDEDEKSGNDNLIYLSKENISGEDRSKNSLTKTGLTNDSFNNKEIIYNVFKEKLNYYFKKDIGVKSSTIGPHRDDLLITLDNKDLRYFGSQGQQRIAAICLRLAEIEILVERINDKPLLLLDDVLSELDIERKKLLLNLIKNNFQTFITTANYDYINDIELKNCQKFFVEDNSIKLFKK
jgi:DNA replication and repair protein RecF